MSDILGLRTNVSWFTATPVTAGATEQLVVFAGTRQSVAVTSTSTMMTPVGRTMRIERFTAAYLATATSGWALVRLRVKPNSAISVTDPVALQIQAGTDNPTTPNSSRSNEVYLCDGLEIPAGYGWGVTVVGMSGATPTATGLLVVEVSGFEYVQN